MHTLNFTQRHQYSSADVGIPVAIKLRSGEAEVGLTAYLDTGAAHCIFDRTFARMLGIEVEQGDFMRFSTVNGTFGAYGHWLDILVDGFVVNSHAFFPEDETVTRNVLGRIGWLNRFRVGLDHDSCELFIEAIS